MTSNNAESLLIAALGGMGIVLFPDWLIGDRLQKGELVALLAERECAINTEPLNIAAILSSRTSSAPERQGGD